MADPLSIVVPTHSRPDLLARCLGSIARHAPAGTETVVVDDASPGGAASTVAAAFPGVRIVRFPERRGFCHAANAGLRAARSPWVQLLNDDAEVTAGWAAVPLARFADPQVGAVAPLVLLGPPGAGLPRVDSAGDSWDAAGVARKRGHGLPLSRGRLRPGWTASAAGSAAFYRRSAVLGVGGFAESFGAYFEDVDLSLRLRSAGLRVWYEPASVVWHRPGSSHGRPVGALLEQQSRNEERLFWRHLPDGQWWHLVPRHLAVLAAKAALRGRSLVPWLRGRLSAWRELATASGSLTPRTRTRCC
jgi:GT2 family glycosyltransferase